MVLPQRKNIPGEPGLTVGPGGRQTSAPIGGPLRRVARPGGPGGIVGKPITQVGSKLPVGGGAPVRMPPRWGANPPTQGTPTVGGGRPPITPGEQKRRAIGGR